MNLESLSLKSVEIKEEIPIHLETECELEDDEFWDELLEEDEMFNLQYKDFFWKEMSYNKLVQGWLNVV